jgi:hypothetical protein
MGMYATAHLAYGYSLGNYGSRDVRFVGVAETSWGEPGLPAWWVGDPDVTGDDDNVPGDDPGVGIGFVEQFARRLLIRARVDPGAGSAVSVAERLYGVTFVAHGAHAHGQTYWLLAARGSEKSVEWSEVVAVDDLTPPAGAGRALSRAAAALDLDTRGRPPQWLLAASYG